MHEGRDEVSPINITEWFALPADVGATVANPRRAAALLSLAVLAIAAAVGAVELLAATGEPLTDLIVRLLISCILAGVLEELLFRGAAFPLLIAVFRNDAGRGGADAGAGAGEAANLSAATRKAALAQAAVFALLHLTGTVPAGITGIVLVQALAKIVQALAFGVIMAAVYVLTRNLAVPIAVHVGYDLLSLFPRELFSGPTATYLTGSGADALVMALTAAALAATAVFAWRALR